MTHTIRGSYGFLVLSRPATPLSSARARRLFHIMGRLERARGVTIVFVARHVRRILEVYSSCAIVEGKRIISAAPVAPRAASGRVISGVLKHSFRRGFPGRIYRVKRGSFMVSRLARHRGHMGSISVCMEGKRVIKLTNLMNTKGARLYGAVFNTCRGSKNALALGNERLGVGGPSSTMGGEVTLMPRREHGRNILITRAIAFGVSTTYLKSFYAVSFMGSHGATRGTGRCMGDLDVGAPSMGREITCLSKKGRRGITITG